MQGGLLITRRIGEGIKLRAGADTIRIYVESRESRSGEIRLRIQAPPSVEIIRDELRDTWQGRAVAEHRSDGAAEPPK